MKWYHWLDCCILRSTISMKIHGFVIFMYTYWWWKCWNYCRLSSYVPKHRTLSLDAMKVKYSSASKDIKLYTDASTNGVKRNTAVVNQNVRVCFRFISVWLWMLFKFSQSSLMWFGFYPRIRIMNHWKTSLLCTCLRALFDYFLISSMKDKNTFDIFLSKLLFTCTFAQSMWNWFDLKNFKSPFPP